MPRVDPPQVADERTMLIAWIDFHRQTLRRKCEGLTDDQLRARSVPPSSLSLLGLVRHYAEVEHYWWRRVVGQQPELPPVYCTPERRDADFDDVDTASVAEAFAVWEAEVAHGRQVLEGLSLEDTVPDGPQPMSVRWLLVHLVEEYARHSGHADLLREAIDGVRGE